MNINYHISDDGGQNAADTAGRRAQTDGRTSRIGREQFRRVRVDHIEIDRRKEFADERAGYLVVCLI